MNKELHKELENGEAFTVKTIIIRKLSRGEKAKFDKNLDHLPLEKLRLYPNPGNRNFLIELKSNSSTPIQIKLTNMAGRVVYHETKNMESRSFSGPINLGKQQSGVYILQIIQDG